MFTPEQTWQTLTRQVRTVKPALGDADLRPEASLTGDLGFGSLELVQLSAGLASDLPDLDLVPWLAQACHPGGDSLSSLASHLQDAAPREAHA